MTTFARFVPTVERRWLFLAAALLWGLAGLMLLGRAVGWLAPEHVASAAPLAAIGILAGIVVYRFKFAWIADKNIKRIDALSDRESLLRFQSGMTYLLIVLMMGLGIALRSSPVPKPDLAVLYIGIGLGLLLASSRYARRYLG